MTLNKKAYFIALGGINEKNFRMIKLLRTNGFASISWAKKNGLRKLRPF
jgi:thiamine-phosphate pyrophosphorylase